LEDVERVESQDPLLDAPKVRLLMEGNNNMSIASRGGLRLRKGLKKIVMFDAD